MIARFNDHLGSRLGALVDGELAHDDRDRALAHLAGCVQCRTLVDAERRLKGQLTAMAMPEPSARLMAALFQIPQAYGPDEQPPAAPPPSASGGLLSRSAAFFPEFAVGLRPLGEPPDDASSAEMSLRTRPVRSQPLRGRGVLVGGEASFQSGQTVPEF
jgi:anti-sigma factor RsiW